MSVKLNKKRITIDISKELHKLLKATATFKNETIRKFTIKALKDRIEDIMDLKEGDVVASLAVMATLGFVGAPLLAWTAVGIAWLWLIGTPLWLLIVLALPVVVLNVPAARRALVTRHIFRIVKQLNLLPTISETERTAIEAGTVLTCAYRINRSWVSEKRARSSTVD